MNTLNWTEIPDVYGDHMVQRTGSFHDLVNRVRTVGSFPRKDKCPLIKLATFGDKRSPIRYEKNKQGELVEKGDSLRWDDNVQAIYGIEGDYDSKPDKNGNRVTLAQAVGILQSYGIRALLHPTDSSTEAEPCWRVLCPLARQHAPGAHSALLKRLNGALGGILAGESFTLSQTYYFGATPNNACNITVTFDDPDEGTCIDDLDELDEIAIGKGDTPAQPAEGVHPNLVRPGNLWVDFDDFCDRRRNSSSLHT